MTNFNYALPWDHSENARRFERIKGVQRSYRVWYVNEKKARATRRGISEYIRAADEFLTACGVTFKAEFLHTELDDYGGQHPMLRARYKCTLTQKNKSVDFVFTTSADNTFFGESPTAYDLLACLQKDDVGTFDNFCDNFGYSNDSIKARDVYFEVQKEYDKVRRFFTIAQLDQLREIQ